MASRSDGCLSPFATSSIASEGLADVGAASLSSPCERAERQGRADPGRWQGSSCPGAQVQAVAAARATANGVELRGDGSLTDCLDERDTILVLDQLDCARVLQRLDAYVMQRHHGILQVLVAFEGQNPQSELARPVG